MICDKTMRPGLNGHGATAPKWGVLWGAFANTTSCGEWGYLALLAIRARHASVAHMAAPGARGLPACHGIPGGSGGPKELLFRTCKELRV
jgi:hypothetical protein